MIQAYDAELFQTTNEGADLNAYIQSTTVAASAPLVKSAIFQFMIDHQVAAPVEDFLNRLTCDPALLGKTRIVRDRAWRNCVVRVTPETVDITTGGISYPGGRYDVEATLGYWARHAEAIFLELTTQPDWKMTLVESMEYLLNWTFKRQWTGGPSRSERDS